MTLVLMAVGLLVTAAGLLTIGFGIPINAFSLGNTLIISGTVASVGGLILIGLAAVLAQLRRIGEGLKGKAPVRAADMREAATHSAPRIAPEQAPLQSPLLETMAAELSRAPEPPRAPEPLRGPEPPYASEPRFPATASEPAPGPLDWLRAKSKPVTTPVPSSLVPPAMSEPPMVELTDEAPLSPRSPQRPMMPPAVEAAMEPKIWSPNRDAGSQEPRLPPRAEQPMPRATPQAEPAKERFDLVWPDRGAAPAPSEARSEVRPELKSEVRPDVSAEDKLESKPEPTPEKREPAGDMPLPPIPARPREIRPASERRMPEILRKPIAERGPTILKSGVIDGMPYTLYADGSIEAQLPHGMVKFASVDALRAHLEKQS